MKKILSVMVLIISVSILGKEFYYKEFPTMRIHLETESFHNLTYNKSHLSYQPSEYQSYHHNYQYIYYTAADFQLLFHNTSSETEILSNYELYKYRAFREYACTLISYKDFITQFHQKIRTDKSFRNKQHMFLDLNISLVLDQKNQAFINL